MSFFFRIFAPFFLSTMKRVYSLFILAAIMLSSCGGSRKAATAPAEAQTFDKEHVWQLVSIRGKEVSARDGVVTLIFYPEGNAIRGHIACNRYSSDYVVCPGKTDADGTRYSLIISCLSGGDVQCPEGDMAYQERYLTLLGKADACLLTAYSLTLYQHGKEILRFELQ